MSEFDTIPGGVVNVNRKPFIERGRIYDTASMVNVDGVHVRLGTSDLYMTDVQALQVAQLIMGEFAMDRYERDLESAMHRHPAGKFKVES